MSHGATSLSGRLYQVNPGMTEHNDIAHDPADVPPPITRREPQAVRVDLETIEVEAHLDANSTFRSKALNPGLYVYHCAVAPVALHIANGMYGVILVKPEEGLAPVDREFYVMQGEIYAE